MQATMKLHGGPAANMSCRISKPTSPAQTPSLTVNGPGRSSSSSPESGPGRQQPVMTEHRDELQTTGDGSAVKLWAEQKIQQ